MWLWSWFEAPTFPPGALGPVASMSEMYSMVDPTVSVTYARPRPPLRRHDDDDSMGQTFVMLFAWFILNCSFSIGTMGFIKILWFKFFKMLTHVRGEGKG